LLKVLKEDTDGAGTSAAWALSSLREKTPPEAIDSMVAKLDKLNSTRMAALTRIGNPEKYREEFARALLPHPSGMTKGAGVTVFDMLAPDYPELIPTAAKLFPTLNGNDRGRLATALGKHGLAAKEVVPQLIELLADEGLHHAEVASALGSIGPEAKAALPDLRKLMLHPELKVVLAARDAIEKIEGQK
jgi:HEAT repeat protein